MNNKKIICADRACKDLEHKHSWMRRDETYYKKTDEPKPKHWLALLLEYAREAKALNIPQEYIDEVRTIATSKNRETLDAVLAVEFYKLRQLK